MFWYATKLRKSMEIGNGIDRRKPLNAHVNLHRLLFYILHILGEICTARKSFTSLVGTVGQLSLSTMNVFTTFVKQKGEKWYGKISKWRFFYPLFLLQIWRCVYPCTCFFLCLCKLQSEQVTFVLAALGQVSPPACLVSHICWANAFRIFKCNAPGSQVANKKINRYKVNWNG